MSGGAPPPKKKKGAKSSFSEQGKVEYALSKIPSEVLQSHDFNVRVKSLIYVA